MEERLFDEQERQEAKRKADKAAVNRQRDSLSGAKAAAIDEGDEEE